MKSKVARLVILLLLLVIPFSEKAFSGDLETIYQRMQWLKKTQEGNKKQIELAERMIDNASYWLNRRDLLLLPADFFGPVPVPRNLFMRRAEDLELDVRSKAFTGEITPYEAEERLIRIKRRIKDVEYANLKARKTLQEIKTNAQEDIKNIKRSNEEIDREIAILGRQIKSLNNAGKDQAQEDVKKRESLIVKKNVHGMLVETGKNVKYKVVCGASFGIYHTVEEFTKSYPIKQKECRGNAYVVVYRKGLDGKDTILSEHKKPPKLK